MKERIIEFLKSENKTSAQFAEEIGVQPSSISHIISGRNNPSLDFVMKMLSKYPALSSDWLLFGKGNMTRESIVIEPFQNNKTEQTLDFSDISENIQIKEKQDISSKQALVTTGKDINGLIAPTGGPSRIICFYDNNTFTEYLKAEK